MQKGKEMRLYKVKLEGKRSKFQEGASFSYFVIAPMMATPRMIESLGREEVNFKIETCDIETVAIEGNRMRTSDIYQLFILKGVNLKAFPQEKNNGEID